MPRNQLTSRLIIITICSLFFRAASAQVISKNGLVKITAAADSLSKVRPIEKLYLKFDKPYYTIGDTIWFKAWILNAASLQPSAKSGIFYIEFVDADNKLVSRMMLPVANGISWGNLILDDKQMPEGNYTIRAYTGWMCNFGDDYIFKKDFYFFNAPAHDRLIKSNVKLSADNGIKQAHIGLQFSLLNKEPVALKQMELNVMDGGRVLYKKEVQTKANGAIDVDLALKSPPKHLSFIFADKGSNEASGKFIVPVNFDVADNTDVQFMPEGGDLVAGLPGYIGFKAIGEDGKAVDVEGKVYDGRQQEVASFGSTHKGIGAFDLIPQAGEAYTASVVLPGGLVKTYPLPPVKIAGTVLKIRQVAGIDSLAITVTGTHDGDSYYLVGRSRGVVCYAAIVTLKNNAAKIKISAALFPTGVARFTILNATKQPLNERAIFVNHHDSLHIDIKPDKSPYSTRDSVALKIHIADKDGNPVNGSFSIAVTDDGQVKTDSLKDNNIISDLLLTSDLKGNIETPGYYFQPDIDGSIKQQLDNLLLTQGWVGYDWKDIFSPSKQMQYAYEPDFNIKGKVVNIFNKPIANSNVILLSGKPAFVLDTVTNKDGRFTFKNIIPIDTPAYILQARNKNGRSFNVALKVDEFNPPAFAPSNGNIIPWYVNSDTTLINYAKNNIARKRELEKLPGNGHMLKVVTIKAKKIIKGSQNLNGPGNADIIIDEEELEKAGKKSFLDLLQERVKGFREGFLLMQGSTLSERVRTDRRLYSFVTDGCVLGYDQEWYFINDKPVKLVIDGIPLFQILIISCDNVIKPFRDISDYLKSHSAEDIKGIEVMSSAKYASIYVPLDSASRVTPSDIAFVEITTRSGKGPDIGNTPGTYLYKPLPFSLPKQFYSPKYPVKKQDTVPDYRSTIYWKPNVVTNLRGNATVTFYTADIKGNYTVILEGIDGKGAAGSSRSKIKVNNK